jgi:hypothetical protein
MSCCASSTHPTTPRNDEGSSPLEPATPSLSFSRSVLSRNDTETAGNSNFKALCFKIFVVVTSVLAIVILVTGILALMASRGWLPEGMGAVQNLAEIIGEVHSWVMIAAGIGLFIITALAWTFHLHKEKDGEMQAQSTTPVRRQLVFSPEPSKDKIRV